jgi:hypothetical protein
VTDLPSTWSASTGSESACIAELRVLRSDGRSALLAGDGGRSVTSRPIEFGAGPLLEQVHRELRETFGPEFDRP